MKTIFIFLATLSPAFAGYPPTPNDTCLCRFHSDAGRLELFCFTVGPENDMEFEHWADQQCVPEKGPACFTEAQQR